MWYRNHIGGDRCPVVDTWWQTETGAIMITPAARRHRRPSRVRRCRRSRGSLPTSSMTKGKSVGNGSGGYLVITEPWPGDAARHLGRPRALQGDLLVAVPGVYFTGDGAKRDEDGDFWLLGRVDDVMNVSGHRISTTEVESALVGHPRVAEAAVVGATDATTGQAIVAFVTVKGEATREEAGDALVDELRDHVATVIGPIAKPRQIILTPELPKTRSGKIMRRLLKDVAEHRELGDVTTLLDPTVVNLIDEQIQAGGGAEAD